VSCATLEKEKKEILNEPYTKRRWREAHSASDGLVTPFDLDLLSFMRHFLLHGTGPARGLPRLARKGVCVTIERRLGSSALGVAIE
jgi:hypothetical protein